VGIVPSCASMGSGGMRYDLLFDPSFISGETTSQ
jgi:hypothetical protein